MILSQEGQARTYSTPAEIARKLNIDRRSVTVLLTKALILVL